MKKEREFALNNTEKEVFQDYVEFIKEHLNVILEKEERKEFFLEVFKDAINLEYNEFFIKYNKAFKEYDTNLNVVDYILKLNQDVSKKNKCVNSLITIPYNIITEGKVSSLNNLNELEKKINEARNLMKFEVTLELNNLENKIKKLYSDNSSNKIETSSNKSKYTKEDLQEKRTI